MLMDNLQSYSKRFACQYSSCLVIQLEWMTTLSCPFIKDGMKNGY